MNHLTHNQERIIEYLDRAKKNLEMNTVQPLDEQAILKARAEIFSKEITRDQYHENEIQVIEFTLGSEHFCIDLSFIDCICECKEVVWIPSLPHFGKGIFNVHGRIIYIIDLKKLFSLIQTNNTESSCIIVVQFKDITLGFLVDYVCGVKKIELNSISCELPMIENNNSNYLNGMVSNEIAMIDVEKIICDECIVINYSDI